MKPCWLAVVSLSFVLPAFGTPPEIDFVDDTVVVSTATPNASVVLFGAGTIQKKLHPAGVDYVTLLTDDDRDGQLMYPAQPRVPWRSVWIAVDVTTGEWSVKAPGTFPARKLQPPEKLVQKTNVGQLHQWAHELSNVNLLLVRPGHGVWTFRAVKGAYGDDEKSATPGFATTLRYFQPLIEGSPALRNFKRGDVVVAIDPFALEYYALTLGEVEE